MNPLKNCKLSEQNMASLCSLHNRHRGLIILPGNKRQRRTCRDSLRQKLDEFERRNRLAKIWRVSTLPTFNRNDGKFLRDDTNEAGEPIRVYSDIKRQCFEMPAPNWASVTRTRRIFTGEFRTYYTQNKYTELNKVWHWDPVKKFTFTVEEREVVVRKGHQAGSESYWTFRRRTAR